MKSYPIPSTLYERTSLGPARIDPSGSTPTTWIFSSCLLRALATPVTVPPVPAVITTASSRP